MKTATLDLTPELFVEFCKLCKSGPSRRYIIKQNPLPDDAEVVEVRLRSPFLPHTLQLVIKSESFVDVPEGGQPPELPPIWFETIYDNPHDYCKGGCGLDFNEFPEMRHSEEECSGPECTCYEVIGGHQMGCYFYNRPVN